MASLSDYLEGIVRVPLSLLTSEGFAECPLRFSELANVPDFEDFLSNQAITGIVNPETLDDMLNSIGISKTRFRETLQPQQAPCLNHAFTIHCLLGQSTLERAINALGPGFECTVRVFCIRPGLSSLFLKSKDRIVIRGVAPATDGEIYQQVRRHEQAGRVVLAQQWHDKLREGKQKHCIAILGRRRIKEAIDTVLPFPGLWDEFLLGNWAKHLAAHVDELICNYWYHISGQWSAIFRNLEHLRHLADAQTVRHLRYKAPAWSTRDRDKIEEGFESGTYFPNIQGKHDRDRLRRNILSLRCVIPSILTFDENMRYLTIAAKILERSIELKPGRKRKRGGVGLKLRDREPESLFDNLSNHWRSDKRLCEVAEGQFREVAGRPSPEFAFLQLILIAWRKFPQLGPEAPLQDIKGIGITAFLDVEEEARICNAARILGYRNSKILDSVDPDIANNPRRAKSKKVKTSNWRGGKPTIRTLRSLKKTAFYPRLLQQYEAREEPEPACIQADLVRAFFRSETLDLDGETLDFDETKPPFGYETLRRRRDNNENHHSSDIDGLQPQGDPPQEDTTMENLYSESDQDSIQLPSTADQVPQSATLPKTSMPQNKEHRVQKKSKRKKKKGVGQKRQRLKKHRSKPAKGSSQSKDDTLALYVGASSGAGSRSDPNANSFSVLDLGLPQHLPLRSEPLLSNTMAEESPVAENEQDQHQLSISRELVRQAPSLPPHLSRRSFPEPPVELHPQGISPDSTSPAPSRYSFVSEESPLQGYPSTFERIPSLPPFQETQGLDPQFPFDYRQNYDLSVSIGDNQPVDSLLAVDSSNNMSTNGLLPVVSSAVARPRSITDLSDQSWSLTPDDRRLASISRPRSSSPRPRSQTPRPRSQIPNRRSRSPIPRRRSPSLEGRSKPSQMGRGSRSSLREHRRSQPLSVDTSIPILPPHRSQRSIPVAGLSRQSTVISTPRSSPRRPRSEMLSGWEDDLLDCYQPSPKRRRLASQESDFGGLETQRQSLAPGSTNLSFNSQGGPDIALGGDYSLPDRPDSGRSPPRDPIGMPYEIYELP